MVIACLVEQHEGLTTLPARLPALIMGPIQNKGVNRGNKSDKQRNPRLFTVQLELEVPKPQRMPAHFLPRHP